MQSPFLVYALVALGSALGGMARQWCGVLALRYIPQFPWAGTVGINVLGSFVIGAFAALTASNGRWPLGELPRVFVMVGLCGGYTTFSSFSLQSLKLLLDGLWLQAGANILLSVVLCLAAVAIGHFLALRLN
jgi:fluoride exporter